LATRYAQTLQLFSSNNLDLNGISILKRRIYNSFSIVNSEARLVFHFSKYSSIGFEWQNS